MRYESDHHMTPDQAMMLVEQIRCQEDTRATIRVVLEAVERETGVPMWEMLNTSDRSKEVVNTRMIAVGCLRDIKRMSYPQIAMHAYGNKWHMGTHRSYKKWIVRPDRVEIMRRVRQHIRSR